MRVQRRRTSVTQRRSSVALRHQPRNKERTSLNGLHPNLVQDSLERGVGRGLRFPQATRAAQSGGAVIKRSAL
jgi:hypothetical protein